MTKSTSSKITGNFDHKNQGIETTENTHYVSRKEAAKLIGVTEPTLLNWEKIGILKAKRVKHRVWYRFDQISSLAHDSQNNKDTDLDSYYSPNTANSANLAKLSNTSSNSPSSQTPFLLTSADYQSKELLPFKCQAKVIDTMISYSSGNSAILVLFLGMLLTILLKLLHTINSEPRLQTTAYQLQDEFLAYQQSLHHYTPQGVLIEEKTRKPEKLKKATLWQKSISAAHSVFFSLTRASQDASLDEEERNRAQSILNDILEPHQNLTKFLHEYKPGDLQHDIAMLLLLKTPGDYQIGKQYWSTRDISKVCQTILGTKSASKSSVGRFLKSIGWKTAIRPKMLSSDPDYGSKILALGETFVSLSEDDEVFFSDEVRYTSSKIAEHLKEKKGLKGMNISLPFALHQTYYKTKAALQITGLLNGKSQDLELKELKSYNFQEYSLVFIEMVKKALMKVRGTMYIVLDNAPYHSPQVLKSMVTDEFGEKVKIQFLPKYAPNHNPIERKWGFLLDASERAGETAEELREQLEIAMNHYDNQKLKKDLKLHCEVCGKKWVFTEEEKEGNEISLRKHLCFKIKDLNPYCIYVLKFGLDLVRLGWEVN
jgi:hypothetical protein